MVKKYSKQARIETPGPNRTTPGMERKPIAERIPVDIYGRTYVDPKKADLTDIEKAYDKAKATADELSEKVKKDISDNANNRREQEIQKKVQEKLKEIQEKSDSSD